MVSKVHETDIKLYYILYILGIVSIPILFIAKISCNVLVARYALHYADVSDDIIPIVEAFYNLAVSFYAPFIVIAGLIQFYIVPSSKMWKSLVYKTGTPEKFSKRKTLQNMHMLADKFNIALPETLTKVLAVMIFMLYILASLVCVFVTEYCAINMTDTYVEHNIEPLDEYIESRNLSSRIKENILREFDAEVFISENTINSKTVVVHYDDIVAFYGVNDSNDEIQSVTYIMPSYTVSDDGTVPEAVTKIHDFVVSEYMYLFGYDYLMSDIYVPERTMNFIASGDLTDEATYSVLNTVYGYQSAEVASINFNINEPIIFITRE